MLSKCNLYRYVLADRAAVLVDDMKPREITDLTWSCASCRHAAPALFQAINVRAAVTGLKVGGASHFYNFFAIFFISPFFLPIDDIKQAAVMSIS